MGSAVVVVSGTVVSLRATVRLGDARGVTAVDRGSGVVGGAVRPLYGVMPGSMSGVRTAPGSRVVPVTGRDVPTVPAAALSSLQGESGY